MHRLRRLGVIGADDVAAVTALAALLAEIVRLVRAGLMPPECADALCVAHPALRPLLPTLPHSQYQDARMASQVARGRDEADELAATRSRLRGGETAAERAERDAEYVEALDTDADTDPPPEVA